ncbi:pyroglutamyl-peptidase 1 [Microplitis demolitor]|uniref:pyroglutamyl-peptidase 1 n=1 Tax=Microplitis demolitor TaxID=69319 RepID=UPI0004CC9DBB|nr:pyroglutamyl-peptidase 1 [Microplitis demolitor]
MDEVGAKNIVVTGFGPFGCHVVNASWEAVKELSKISTDKLKTQYNVNLIIEEIPVAYDHVSNRVPEIWENYDPLFVIHVGVSAAAKCLTIENKAHGTGYSRKDIKECCPCEDGDEDCKKFMTTEIDVDNICEEVNKKGVCKACVSDNAGRYLCEYTYYQSLRVQCKRTIFVHVPDFNVYPTSLTAQGLDTIVCHLLENLQ